MSTSSFIVSSLLLIIASSQCKWTVQDNYGQEVSLDLTPLHAVTMNITDTDQPPHYYLYTPCRNNEICQGANVMVKQTIPDEPWTCYILGRWDYSKAPQYEDIEGGTWTFIYDNGADDCGNPARTWSPKYICHPGVKYQVGTVKEIPNSCFYEVTIRTEFACPDWTTTTTSIPSGRCIFTSENGSHVLNMTSIRGKLLSGTDADVPYLYYMYTPCMNSAKCNDNKVMAYLFDGMNFECKQSLAIWEDGFIEPNYIDGIGMWQFTYTNGQSCNGGQTVFNVEWFCDKTAASPKVIQAKETATCVYQMVINSTLACG